MALSQQTEQLFARVFGRGSETSEERGFLKDLEARKGVGTQESFGALQFAQKEGKFGSPEQTAGSAPASPGSIDAVTGGMELLEKKMLEADKLQKKLFREEQKLVVKQQLLSDPGYKETLAAKSGLRDMLNTKDFSEDVPVTPGITNPLDVSRAALGQQEGIGSFISNADTVLNEGEESVTSILDKLGKQRQSDYDNARQSIADLITLRQEGRADEQHQLNMQKGQLELTNLASGMTPEQRVRLGLDVAAQYNVSVDEANEIIDRFAGGFTPGSNGMRTDRHNNPAAFTTDVAEQAGLKFGIDYTTGDPFPNNPNMRTAKLLGDPIALTIKAIDNIGFYTQSGAPRWTYLSEIPEHKKWNSLNAAQKRDVIAKMYQREGGSGQLLAGAPVVTGIVGVQEQSDPTAGLTVLGGNPGLIPVSGNIPQFTLEGGAPAQSRPPLESFITP